MKITRKKLLICFISRAYYIAKMVILSNLRTQRRSRLSSLYFLLHYSYPIALDLVASGKVNVKPLITHRFKLEQSHDAFKTSGAGTNAIKVMINCEKEN